MSRFNTVSEGTKTVNKAGGEAFKQSPELELVSILLTSFANDQFYESANTTFTRLKELVKICDKKFVAQAAVYARTQFGMRSITHCVASELAKHISGEPWAKDFYAAIVYRPDDMMEILSYHEAHNGKLPNSIKKGFATAFSKFDSYSLAKYRGEGKGFKLVDVVNLVHPVPVERNAEAILALIKGQLKSTETWEAMLTKAGQTATSEEEKMDLKKDAWMKLIGEKKIKYFALLKNLRNIIEQAPEAIDLAIAMLTDETLIKKSLVLPFRYLTAYEEIAKLNDGKIIRSVLVALNKAVDISLNNVPKFEGETLVVLDTSGSMTDNPKTPPIASLFAATIAKSNNADFMTFDRGARYVNLNPADSTITLSKQMEFNGGGTDFHAIFTTANKKYDRIIILSDMQGWIGRTSPVAAFNEYKKVTGATPFIYSFDLNHYGTMQFPEKNVFCLAGFSEKTLTIMEMLEADKNAMVNVIKKVQF